MNPGRDSAYVLVGVPHRASRFARSATGIRALSVAMVEVFACLMCFKSDKARRNLHGCKYGYG